MDDKKAFAAELQKIERTLEYARITKFEERGNRSKNRKEVSKEATEAMVGHVIHENMGKVANIHKYVLKGKENKMDGSISFEAFSLPLAFPYNLYHEVVEIKDKAKVYLDGDREVLKNYISEIIAVQMNNVAAGFLQDHSLYVYKNQLCYRNETGKLIKFNLESTVAVPEDFAEAVKTGKLRKFNHLGKMGEFENDGVLNVTAGEKKSGTVLMHDASNEAMRMHWNACRYAVTCGVSQITERDGAYSQKDLCQGSNRVSQAMAPNLNIGKVGNMALLAGKFKDAEGNEAMDGFAVLSDEAITFWLNMLSPKYVFNSAFVRGMLFQCRMYSMKTLGIAAGPLFMKSVLQHLSYSEVVVIRRNDYKAIKEGLQARFNSLWWEKKGADAGKLFVIVDDEEAEKKLQFDGDGKLIGGVEVITDLNGAKAPWALASESGWPILSVSHGTKNVSKGASMSSQMLQTAALYDWEGTKELVSEICERKAETLTDRVLEDRPCSYFSEREAEETSVADAIISMTGEIGKKMGVFYRHASEQALKSLLSDSRTLNFKLGGFYTKAEPEIGAWFGKKFLGRTDKGYIQCYSPLANRLGIKYAIGVKYPKAGSEEFVIIEFVSKAEYRKMVMRSDLSADDKAACLEMINATSEGALVMPDIEIIKNLLAGMDFDGDSIIVITEPVIVETFAKIKFKAVKIDDDDNGRLTSEEVEGWKAWWKEFTEEVFNG